MRKFLLGFLGLAFSVVLPARGEEPSVASTVDVWPSGQMPGQTTQGSEKELPSKGDGVQRITNVSRPTLTVLADFKKSAPAAAVIICPGGAYSHLCFDKEGTDIARWLNGLGIEGLVLKYRVPKNPEGALQDLERAVSLVRSKAAEWKIDPKRIGVMGFSAGGNLAAKVSAPLVERAYAAMDAVDRESCRPDFAVLVYPAYLEKGGRLTPDLNLNAKIPPTLIVHNADDEKYVAGSRLYHAALDAAKIPHAFLFYQTGGHGYGLRSESEVKAWPEDAAKWLREIEVVPSKHESEQ